MTRKPGRPAYEPTDKDRAQVSLLAAMGVPDYDIAKVMQVSGPTLRKYFAQELEVGHIQANAKVAQSLFRQATDQTKPSVAATIFWLKCRAGWRETATPDGSWEPIGKKEQANVDAVTAAAGTDWADLLPPGVSPLRKTG